MLEKKLHKKQILLVLMALVISLVVLTGCSSKSPASLEEYVSTAEGGSDIVTDIVADDPNATVSFDENMMIFTYKIEDETVTGEMLEGVLEGLGDTFSEIITDLETRTGIKDITVKVIYIDESGEEISTKVFE